MWSWNGCRVSSLTLVVTLVISMVACYLISAQFQGIQSLIATAEHPSWSTVSHRSSEHTNEPTVTDPGSEHTNKPTVSAPAKGNLYLTVDLAGRLGNNIYQYAALLALAKRNGRIPVLTKTTPLLYKVYNITCQKSASGVPYNWLRLKERCFGIYETKFESLPQRNVTIASSYFQSYKYSKHAEDTVVSELTRFLPDVARRAKSLLDTIPGLNRRTTTDGKAAVVVGAHVRRTDKASKEIMDLGENVVPLKYFHKAFDWMRRKYGEQVHFAVASDNLTWARENLNWKNVFFFPEDDFNVHFAALTLCDHMVISQGSFSWWAGYLTGGDVIYFDRPFEPGSVRYRDFKKEDFFPPHWIGMDGH